jgi:predicted ester cyclase
MNKSEKTKKFYLKYYKAMTDMKGKKKNEQVIRKFVSDEKLIGHILFFDEAFPGYELIPKEIIVADDRIFVRADLTGTHKGALNNTPPTFKNINVPFAICYRVENEMIVDHWMIADQMELLEQLGLAGTIKPAFEKMEDVIDP